MAETGKETENHKDFFISFTSRDKQWAEWIAWELEEAGYKVIFQSWDFHAGNSIPVLMDNALRQAERVIAVFSPAYFQSSFTPSEWGAAFMRDPKGERSLLIPILVEECEELGLLGQIAYIDIRGYDEERAREKLTKGINRERNKPTKAPIFPGASSQAKPDQTALVQQPKPAFPGQPTGAAPHDELVGRQAKSDITGLVGRQAKSDITGVEQISAEGEGAVKVFFSYADQDLDMLKELEKHLAVYRRNGQIICWDRRQIPPVANEKDFAHRELTKANIIFLLISSDYLNSDECYHEMKYALEHIHPGKVATLPVLVREAATLSKTPLNGLLTLPRFSKPIDQWRNKDKAWSEIVKDFDLVFNIINV